MKWYHTVKAVSDLKPAGYLHVRGRLLRVCGDNTGYKFSSTNTTCLQIKKNLHTKIE